MKIALLTDGIYPYVMGGMQKHSYYLCKFFAQNGIEVDLYHTNKQEEYDISKLEFFTDEEKENINSYVIEFPKSDGFIGHYLRSSYKYSERVFNALQKNNPVDFIYAKGLSGWHTIKQKEKGMSLPPIGINIHGYEMYQIAPSFKVKLSHFLLRPAFKYINQNTDYVFSYGGNISTIINKKLNVSKEKILDVSTGISSDWLNVEVLKVNKIRKFVFVGRFERRKGVQEISKAIQELIPNYNFEFHFIGPIPKKNQIIHNKVIYHGKIMDIEKIKYLLQQSDVLFCPSYSEGMPTVIMEGMASGCAIIMTDVGGIKSQLNNNINNGWIIPPANQKMLLNVFKEALKIDDEQLLYMKENSIQFVKDKLLWKNAIKETISAIKIILNDSLSR